MEQRPTWHPLLAARELEPSHWVMIDSLGAQYGDIRLVKRGGEVGYRATNREGQLVGYYRTLRKSAEVIHYWFLRDNGDHSKGEYGQVR